MRRTWRAQVVLVLLPVSAGSAHWLGDERLAAAVSCILAGECQGVESYDDEWRERNPFMSG